MGLRAYVLENLLMPEMLISERTIMELHDFNFAYKNGPQILYIRECEIPANRIVAITGNNGAGKSTFPVVSVVWKNNVAQSSGMEKLTDQKKG